MFYLMIVFFVVGYIFIALEHPLHINKSATALLLGTLMWVCLIMGEPTVMPVFADFQTYLSTHPGTDFSSWLVNFPLLEHFGETAEILFFLLGAMTIVELVDTHGGFTIITDTISTQKKSTLLWIIGIITFFLSAILDNMTTAIVMVALLRKLISNKKERWLYAGIVILAANAGGAWSPIGDVTTIMLWIGGRVSAMNIIKMTFLASSVSLLVPLIILSVSMKGDVQRAKPDSLNKKDPEIPDWQRKLIFFLGVGSLLFVPVFKTITHLPPYMGMLGGLSLLWIVTEIIHKGTTKEHSEKYSVTTVLSKVDTSSILFFLGILMAVAALQTYGQLGHLSLALDKMAIPDPEKYYLVTIIIGLFSSVIDNVPLVAGAMGMYNFPMDHYFWEFIAYAAGTGGSILIIGSAAGVAVMGMEKIDFIWYLKKISWIALLGYLAGCAVYILQRSLI